jgi:hypothetical protein
VLKENIEIHGADEGLGSVEWTDARHTHTRCTPAALNFGRLGDDIGAIISPLSPSASSCKNVSVLPYLP